MWNALKTFFAITPEHHWVSTPWPPSSRVCILKNASGTPLVFIPYSLKIKKQEDNEMMYNY